MSVQQYSRVRFPVSSSALPGPDTHANLRFDSRVDLQVRTPYRIVIGRSFSALARGGNVGREQSTDRRNLCARCGAKPVPPGWPHTRE